MQREHPQVSILHHNGGPVKWGAAPWGAVAATNEQAAEKRRKLEGEGVDEVLAQSHILPREGGRCVFISVLPCALQFALEIHEAASSSSSTTLHSFSGYAEWSRAQLLQEIERGSWGVCDLKEDPSFSQLYLKEGAGAPVGLGTLWSQTLGKALFPVPE
jgi:hypothetical protein